MATPRPIPAPGGDGTTSTTRPSRPRAGTTRSHGAPPGCRTAPGNRTDGGDRGAGSGRGHAQGAAGAADVLPDARPGGVGHTEPVRGLVAAGRAVAHGRGGPWRVHAVDVQAHGQQEYRAQ